MNFVVLEKHREEIKESEKIVKYLDLAREQREAVEYEGDGDTNCNWNGPERLEELEIRGRIETIQITALLRSARILRSVLETLGDLLPPIVQWTTTC